MSHMGHFNTTIQQDGINGMKELLVKFPNILVLNLSSLFGKLSELLSAGDSGVRKCSMKLLEHIIQSVPKEKIAPFFPLLNAQLMCSMNHIALDIQKDSHTILDLLLANIPDLVATVVMQVLTYFKVIMVLFKELCAVCRSFPIFLTKSRAEMTRRLGNASWPSIQIKG